MRLARLAAPAALALALLAGPLAAEAQPAARVYRIGFLGISPPNPTTASVWDAFLQGLREHGYVEGKNLLIERRYAEGKVERLPDLAAELLRLNVELIVAPTTPAARAAKQVTTTTPIVMVLAGDPVAVGLVSSLARPGGNVTGLTGQATDWSGKQLQFLKEPDESRVPADLQGVRESRLRPPAPDPVVRSPDRRRPGPSLLCGHARPT
jgi:putative ABC transport system substrate-binding protein